MAGVELSEAAGEILANLPSDGTSIGNGRIRDLCGLDGDVYTHAVDELKQLDLVRSGRGRGGSLSLAPTVILQLRRSERTPPPQRTSTAGPSPMAESTDTAAPQRSARGEPLNPGATPQSAGRELAQQPPHTGDRLATEPALAVRAAVTDMSEGISPTPAAGLSAKQREKVNFIWSVKETLRDHYKRHQYQDVILPFCVLRRLDCVLEPTKDAVVAKAGEIGSEKWDAASDVLAHVAGQPFWNASRFTFGGLLADQHNVRQNVHAYVRGFSPNARDALVRFGLPNQIDKMAEAQILYMVVKQFAEIDLHPDAVSNLEMGYIYEELIRVTADLSNEEAGEHFTPREVIELMVNVLFADDDRLLTPSRIFTVYDPACVMCPPSYCLSA